MIYQIKAKSGIPGWRCCLQENYGDISHWMAYASTFGLASRLGFKSAVEAWENNPIIEGSVNPADFRIAPKKSRLWKK